MNQFSELPLSPVVQRNLDKHGFVTPTPVQAQAIPPAMAGHDVVATAQTGTGKTLAFVLPLLERLSATAPTKGVRAIILSPTRELAIQIEETFVKVAAGTGFEAAVVVGGLNEQRQLHAIRNRGAQILIATPGRLVDFLQRKLVKLSGTEVVVLDEADRMLDMGFLPSLKQILGAVPAQRQTMLFSATIESSVAHLVKNYVQNPVRVEIGSTTKPAEMVDLFVYEVEQDRKLGLLLHLLQQEQGSFLVFARTKHGADRLAKKLVRTPGVSATSIHGDRTQSQRNRALAGFKSGEYRVLVATDVAARGIHVDDVGHVVNYDLPQVPEDYIHRVGRTGRAGARGVASTFAVRAERNDIRKMERTLNVQLNRREVPAEIPVEVKAAPAPHTKVVVMPAPRGQNASGRPQRVGSFGGRSRGR